MTDNNNLEKYFEEWLETDEKIIHADFREKSQVNILLIVSIVLCFLMIYYLLIIDTNFLIFILAILLGGLSVLLYNRTYTSIDSIFAFTDKKIILLDNHHNPKFTQYQHIFNIEERYGNVLLLKEPASRNNSNIHLHTPEFTLNKGSDKKEIMNKLYNAWYPSSPHQTFIKVLSEYAYKNNFTFRPFKNDSNKDLKMEGNIKGNNFTLRMNEMYNFKRLEIKINCRNEEDNYLNIKRASSYGTILEENNYRLGELWFDNQFIVRTNYETFIKRILSETMTKELSSALAKIKGGIVMGRDSGTFTKAKPKKNTNDDLVLDEHLVMEETKKRSRIKNHSSVLVYNSLTLKYTKDYQALAEDIIRVLEMLIYLSQEINEYNAGR